jgi:hypothetical protein
MARRKTRKTKRVHHRRRVSGIKDVDFTAIALVIAGAVGARILSTKLTASTNATMAKLAPYAGLGLGIVLPMVSKNAMVKNLSLGLVAGGGVSMLTGLKVISGFENTISGRVGYPYTMLPYRKVAGLGAPAQGYLPTKSNFSGSRQSQMSVISGVNPDGSGMDSAY